MMLTDIPGHEGRYAITPDGRVWSHPKHPKGAGRRHEGQWLKAQWNARDGKYQIRLRVNGKPHHYRVERLVRLTFGDLSFYRPNFPGTHLAGRVSRVQCSGSTQCV